MPSDVTIIPFTQYLLPNGEKRRIMAPVPDPDGSVARAAEEILSREAVFECEVLRTGNLVSLTVTDVDLGDMYSRLSPIGRELDSAAEMIIEAGESIEEGKWVGKELNERMASKAHGWVATIDFGFMPPDGVDMFLKYEEERFLQYEEERRQAIQEGED